MLERRNQKFTKSKESSDSTLIPPAQGKQYAGMSRDKMIELVAGGRSAEYLTMHGTKNGAHSLNGQTQPRKDESLQTDYQPPNDVRVREQNYPRQDVALEAEYRLSSNKFFG